eukprot:574348-Hanusia_phi.AAC.1
MSSKQPGGRPFLRSLLLRFLIPHRPPACLNRTPGTAAEKFWQLGTIPAIQRVQPPGKPETSASYQQSALSSPCYARTLRRPLAHLLARSSGAFSGRVGASRDRNRRARYTLALRALTCDGGGGGEKGGVGERDAEERSGGKRRGEDGEQLRAERG